jgi:hypothetical protein
MVNSLSIESQGREMIIRINRDSFDGAYLLSLVRRLRLEELAQKASFDEKVLEIAKEINQDWWDEHGKDFLKDIEQ